MKTPIETLQAWLTAPIYDAGVVLYERLVGKGFLLTLLKTGEDAYNREKLTTALTERLQTLLTEEQARQASLPPSLVGQLDRGGLLMDERTILKERMRVLYNSGISESAELKQMAFRILAIKDELDAIYGRKHFFEQNGFLPEVAHAADELDGPEQLLLRRNSLRTYVSKYKKLLQTHFDPIRQRKYKAKLETFQNELHAIDTQLVNLTPNAPPPPL